MFFSASGSINHLSSEWHAYVSGLLAAGLQRELHEVFPALLLSTLTYYLLSRAETPQEAAARS